MEVFNAYCDDLTFLTNDIRNNIDELKCKIGSPDTEYADKLCRTIDSLFDQSDDMIKQVEMEARSQESKDRKIANERVKSYKDTFNQQRSTYQNIIYEIQKSNLVGKSGEDRGRMLDVHQKVRNQNEIIHQACRTVAETEEIGNETIEELKRNREKIDSVREKNREFTVTVDDADKRLKSMWFRHRTWGLFG